VDGKESDCKFVTTALPGALANLQTVENVGPQVLQIKQLLITHWDSVGWQEKVGNRMITKKEGGRGWVIN